MPQKVAPALARKFGEPGGIFDTVLQRLVSEWHRFQLDTDPERLDSLRAILEAGLSQLRSLELLLGADEIATEAGRRTGPAADEEPQGVATVYSADPQVKPGGPPPVGWEAPAEPERPPVEYERPPAVEPSRLQEAMQLIESLHRALEGALGAEALGTEEEHPDLGVSDIPPPTGPPESPTGAPPRPSKPETLAGPSTPETLPPADEARQELETPAGDGSIRPVRPPDGVFPQEAFDVASAAELKRCRRFERSFSLLLLHMGMDADPRAGQVLLGNLREFDLVGRYGGDVFAVGLPETGADAAQLIAHRLIGLLARRGAWAEEGRFGIATYPTDGNTLTTVVRSARNRLGSGSAAE